jgi:hypothetical protein
MSEHGDWACGCIGWTRHFPRNDCRHIKRVKAVEPRDLEIAGVRLQRAKDARIAAARARIQPDALSKKQIADLETQLASEPKRFSKPGPQQPEPFFVRQTRRAISLED